MQPLQFPDHLRYDLSHTWVRADESMADVGLTEFALQFWGKTEFVQLPEAGASVAAGEAIGQILSAGAGPCPVFSPLTGRVTWVNDELTEAPELVDADPYDGGRLLRVAMADAAELNDLLDAAAYRESLDQPPVVDLEEHLGPVFTHSGDAMVLIDRYRRVLAQNAAAEELTGYRMAEMGEGCRCYHLFRCERSDGALHGICCAGIQAYRSLRPTRPGRFTIYHRSGKPVPVTVTYSPLPIGEEPLMLITLRRSDPE